MLPLFKKAHIHSRAIEDYVKCGYIRNYTDEPHKRNALRQAGMLFRIVDGELYRHGTEKEYQRYGLRIVIHDDEPEKKAEIIKKCHIDSVGNHFGMNVTLKNVTETYYWQGISSHVKLYMKQCEVCKVRSKMTADEWMENERQIQAKKKSETEISKEAKEEIKNLGRIRKPSPPETFFIVNAEKKVSADIDDQKEDTGMIIDSNNIEYVVETLGHTDEGMNLPEICHVLNVHDIVPKSERLRSREIENFLKYGTFPPDFTTNQKNGLRNPASQYAIIDGELYHDKNKIGSKGVRQVVHDDMPALKVKIMVENHLDEDGSHCGLNKTMRKICEKYHWSGMSIDMRKFMMHCQICNSNRAKRTVYQQQEALASDYQDQVSVLKSKHVQKMSLPLEGMQAQTETEVEEVQAIPFDEGEATEVEPVQTGDFSEGAEGSDGTYNQVIRLIGPDKEVTEITVAVVKPKGLYDENDEVPVVESSDLPEGSVEHMVEVKAEVDATDLADHAETQRHEDSVEEVDLNQENAKGGEETENPEPISEENEAMEAEGNDVENDNNTATEIEIQPLETGQDTENNVDAVRSIHGVVEGEVENVEDDELVQVVVINEDGIEEHKTLRRAELNAMADFVTVAEEAQTQTGETMESYQRIDLNSPTGTVLASHSGQFYYYKDTIFTPKTGRTRAIEYFLRHGHLEGINYSLKQISEEAENYQLVDDVLCRRHVRYKKGRVVVHDNNPEVSL